MSDIGSSMVEDSDDFLYLDDEEGEDSSEKPAPRKISLPKISLPKRKPAKNIDSSKPREENPLDSDEIEISLDGIFQFDWGIRGMDCPDCAMKASRAVNRLPGIQSCKISVAEGTVEIYQDISDGTVARASSVLTSLGHEPDVGWLRAVGANPERAALRLGVDNKGLRNSILSIPGTLDARTDKGNIDVQRVWISDPELRTASEQKMSEVLGEGRLLSPVRESGFRKDQIQLLAAVLTIPLIVLVAAIEASEMIPSAVAWALTLTGVAFAGNQLFKEAIAGLRNRVIGFQVLTSLAIVGAIALGELIESLMVVSLVAFASHLENRALIRARQSMQGGLDRLPRRARLVANGETKQLGAARSLNVINSVSLSLSSDMDCDNDLVPVEALEVGEMIEVRSGETVPVDGVIIEGTGAIDRAPLTGEPIPIPVKVGDRVEAGLVLARGPLVIKTEATGDGTRLSSLIDLVRHYKDKPTRTQSVIERFTLFWTPLVVFASPVIGFLFTNSTEQAILTTLLLWVVSCPCSLLLASPVPHAAALTTASGFGLIARGGDVLESAAEVRIALLDKTGTLTSGRPTISGISVAKGQQESRALRIAAGLEARSNHPYARTIIQEAEARSLDPMSITQIKDGDAGVLGVHRGDSVMLGRADWIRSQEVSFSNEIEKALEESRKVGKGASILAVGGSAIAVISFTHDDARDGVLETVNELSSQGVRVEILSGDEQASVEAFALEIGIDPSLCKGGVDPEGKAEYVTKLSSENRTMMAGDGFNDAGALAAADVGVAVGSGDQVNLDAADVLIPGQDPRVLSRMVSLAKRTRRIVYANIAISVMVTMILVTAVLAGTDINLAAGIALHEASAIIIILNGMWVSGTGTQRLSSLADLARDIFSDMVEIWAIFIGKDSEDTSATS
jgi:Cd2+/Zn2+-exporting ATPase